MIDAHLGVLGSACGAGGRGDGAMLGDAVVWVVVVVAWVWGDLPDMYAQGLGDVPLCVGGSRGRANDIESIDLSFVIKCLLVGVGFLGHGGVVHS